MSFDHPGMSTNSLFLSVVPAGERSTFASSEVKPPSWSDSVMRGGPKGRIHISCNPCRMQCVV
eukprot:11953706-Prorocentrum_lima.AAC.1